MSASEAMSLQAKFARTVASSIKSPWDRLEVHYENILWKEMLFEKYRSAYFASERKFDLPLSLDAIDVLVALKHAVSDVHEPWTHLVFNLHSSGKFDYDFKYGMPPMTADELKAAGELDSGDGRHSAD